ncbi:hypothetical protein DIURU_003673 [Diutina rugosa]|uniref:Uncharacterized protein n=1 Tax=Diutina rugosa TaxID=5481 RepID=A0A642UKJ5_DIURU|nr:uncharacterized protein DIURU_003673 [Diutina rugosa]KAA8900691.1 hypothetical protein DIURU_003673 [Diutina rugosa]
MPYTIGPRDVSLARLRPGDWHLLHQYPHVFAQVLNSTVFVYVSKVEQVVQLYSDALIIYSTLLAKVPNFDEVAECTNRTRRAMLALETDVAAVLSGGGLSWENRPYSEVRMAALLLTEATIKAFKLAQDTMAIISSFFEPFNNLEKLLIPYAHHMTTQLESTFTTARTAFSLAIDVDSIPQWLPDTPTPEALEHLQNIDTLTVQVQKQAQYLETMFRLVDNSLVRYSQVILGKGILKREVDAAECSLIRRRNVCFSAAEQVVSIPLTEQAQSKLPMDVEVLTYLMMALGGVLFIALFRIWKVVLS